MDERTSRLVEAAVVATSKHLTKRWQRIVALLPDSLEGAEADARRLDICAGFSWAAMILEDDPCATPADLRTASGVILGKIEEAKQRSTSYAAILKHCADACLNLAARIEQEGKRAEFQGSEKPENHTPECFALYQQAVELVRQSALEVLAYFARWPGVCQVCNGAGGFSHYDWDSGYDYEPCSCAEAGRCPRCGDLFLQTDQIDEQCPSCGWNAQDPDVIPSYGDGYECYGECKGEPVW